MESALQILSDNINLLNINDDIIIMNSKINNLVTDFSDIVSNEEDLRKVFRYFNEQSLKNSKHAQNFAIFFTSNQMRSFTIGTLNVRTAMMNVLENNFIDADELKQKDICHFYNSVTLLGEYYNRARLESDNKPYQVLGQGLLDLLIIELQRNLNEFMANTKEYVFDVRFAKLILNQVTLNGLLLRAQFKNEIEKLLNEMRKCLLKILNLSEMVKAFFMMTMDLYNKNFTNLGNESETLYANYLIDYENENEINNTDVVDNAKTNNQIEIHNLTNLKDEVIGFSKGLVAANNTLNNDCYIAKPLKLMERLSFIQQQNDVNIEPFVNNCNEFTNSNSNLNDSQINNVENLNNNNNIEYITERHNYYSDHYLLNNIIDSNNIAKSQNLNQTNKLIDDKILSDNVEASATAVLGTMVVPQQCIALDELKECAKNIDINEHSTECDNSNNKNDNSNYNNDIVTGTESKTEIIKPTRKLYSTLYSDSMDNYKYDGKIKNRNDNNWVSLKTDNFYSNNRTTNNNYNYNTCDRMIKSKFDGCDRKLNKKTDYYYDHKINKTENNWDRTLYNKTKGYYCDHKIINKNDNNGERTINKNTHSSYFYRKINSKTNNDVERSINKKTDNNYFDHKINNKNDINEERMVNNKTDSIGECTINKKTDNHFDCKINNKTDNIYWDRTINENYIKDNRYRNQSFHSQNNNDNQQQFHKRRQQNIKNLININ